MFKFLLLHSCGHVDISKKVVEDWVKKNCNRVVLLFDGFDQLKEELKDFEQTPNFKDDLTEVEWLSAIFSRNVLRSSTLILTSRPYAATTLPGSCKPDKNYSLCGFDELDVQEALYFLFDRDYSNKVLEKLRGDMFESIEFTPINLFLIAEVLRESKTSIKDYTTFLLYMEVFEKLVNTKCILVNEENRKTISRIQSFCFKMCNKNKFEFSIRDFKNHSLTYEDFESFTMIDAGCTKESYTTKEEDKRIVLCHQLQQVSKFFFN